ncbi:MAG: hypothetical protein ACFFCI_00640 [Promethearchaeota archaeon]
MFLMLEGRIVTPIISKRTKFSLMGCKVRIKNHSRRYYNKINTGKPMYPFSFIGYLGTIELVYQCKSKTQAERKLKQLLEIEQIGKFMAEGMGLVKWQYGQFVNSVNFPWVTNPGPKYHLRIRKGLPHNLPDNIKQLIRYALLHDFANTSNHKSKIYVEPELEGLADLRKHHDKSGDPVIKIFQKYDHLAAIITRQIRSPRTNRYNWASTSNINFAKLAKEIQEVSNNIWKLYDYIHNSKELGQLNESLQHGHTSLRSHLLIIANLIIRDYLRSENI